MALTIRTGTPPKPPRVVIYGPPGVGKTTFATGARRPVFLPTEDGLANLQVMTIAGATGKLESWGELHEATLMAARAPKDEIATLVVDTITSAQDLCFAEVCSTERAPSIADIPFGKGYPRALTLWIQYLHLLDYARSLGKAVMLLGHAQVESFADPEGEAYDRYSLRLHQQADGKPSLRATTMEWADVVAFANLRAIRKQTGKGFDERTLAGAHAQRVLYTQPSPIRAAKSRYALPPEMPFDIRAFAAELAKNFIVAPPQPAAQLHPEQAKIEAAIANEAGDQTGQPKQPDGKVDLNEMFDPATLPPHHQTQTQASSTEQAS